MPKYSIKLEPRIHMALMAAIYSPITRVTNVILPNIKPIDLSAREEDCCLFCSRSMAAWNRNTEVSRVSRVSHESVAAHPHIRKEPERQPSPTVGFRKAMVIEGPAVPNRIMIATTAALKTLVRAADCRK